MDRTKVEENVRLFLAEGWTRARAEEQGCPVVFKEQYDQFGNIIQQTKIFVREDVTPKTLNNIRLERMQSSKPQEIERTEPA